MQLNDTLIYKTIYNVKEAIDIHTNHTNLVLGVNDETGELLQFYYGKRLKNALELIPQGAVKKGEEFTQAYTTFGRIDHTPACRVTHADGALSTELVYDSHDIAMPSDELLTASIKLKDKYYPFFVTLHYNAWQKEDVIETWVTFSHQEKGEVVLNEYPSVELAFANQYDNYYLTSLQGLWEREHSLQHEKLPLGKKVLENRYGTWSSFGANPSFMLSLGQESTEESGEVVAGALAWSGSWKLAFNHDACKLYHDTIERRVMSVTAGVDNFAADYRLAANEEFGTPKFVMTYSPEGKGLASRNLHRWSRCHCLRDGELERPILLNSWEGAYFDFDEKLLLSMMDRTAEMDGEMFVLDDGWFGNGAYARNGANAGLGDWQVNTAKLPNGLGFLADEANARGLQFGIWVEPEMVNPKSVLFETHPEWVIQQPHREEIMYRNQLLLDLSNPSVQELCYANVANILRDTPGISYVKWDCNRSFTNVGSTYLGKDRQTHIWVDYVKGLYAVYDRLVAEFPKVIFQACASGGGRVDYGILKRNHEFWTSDNTDALQRIFIQWGTNHIYPAIATTAHVTVCPNHQTGRTTPLKFRFDVAMSGRLGLELNPNDMTSDELTFVKSGVAAYKRIRPVVMFGDLYRLVSPYDSDYASAMYVSESKERAVIFAYNINNQLGQKNPQVMLKGLEPAQKYLVTEINKYQEERHISIDKMTLTGETLMRRGIKVSLNKEFDSAVIELTAI